MSDSLKSFRDYFLCASKTTPMGFESRLSRCCWDLCNDCGISVKWKDCPVEMLESLLVTWREYAKVPDAAGHVREELIEVTCSADKFVAHFKRCSIKYLSHYVTYRWLNNTFKFDVDTFEPDEILIQTDFAAQMEMVLPYVNSSCMCVMFIIPICDFVFVCV